MTPDPTATSPAPPVTAEPPRSTRLGSRRPRPRGPQRAARTTRARLATLVGACTLLAGPLGGAAGGAAALPPPATVSAEGDLMPFGPGQGPVAGLTVRVLEVPALTTTTDSGGHWRIDGVPSRSQATFAVDGGERYPIQTATLAVGTSDLTHVSIQSPTHSMVRLLEQVLRETGDPRRCHIATTVTRRGYSLYLGAPDGTHGEPGATVTIDPVPAQGASPVYWNGSRFDLIWPDRRLRATSPDGGVVFVNVTPGTYTLRARKDGAEIRPVTVGCRPGVLTNASPPWGLQVNRGGLGPDETVPFTTVGRPFPTTVPATTGTTGTTVTTVTTVTTPTTTPGAAPPPAAPAQPVETEALLTG